MKRFDHRHAASLQILATVVMLRLISRAIAGSEWPAALSSFTFPRSVITFGRPSTFPLMPHPSDAMPTRISLPSNQGRHWARDYLTVISPALLETPLTVTNTG